MFGKSETNNLRQTEPVPVENESIQSHQNSGETNGEIPTPLSNEDNKDLSYDIKSKFRSMMEMTDVKAKTDVLCQLIMDDPTFMKENELNIFNEWSSVIYRTEQARMVECITKADPNFLNNVPYKVDTYENNDPSSFTNSKYHSIEDSPKVTEEIKSEKILETEMNKLDENQNALVTLKNSRMESSPLVDQGIESDNMMKTEMKNIGENKNSFSNVKDNSFEEIPQVNEEISSQNTKENKKNKIIQWIYNMWLKIGTMLKFK